VGGESKGDSDLAQAVRTAVINKRAGGMGLIVGRKAFQRPMAEGGALIHSYRTCISTTTQFVRGEASYARDWVPCTR
jgi:DhnA family fructose-bisphosphate aldolase class Ia